MGLPSLVAVTKVDFFWEYTIKLSVSIPNSNPGKGDLLIIYGLSIGNIKKDLYVPAFLIIPICRLYAPKEY